MNSEEIFNNIKNNTRTTVTKEFDPQEILKNIEADKTKDVDVNVTDQKSVPQYIDVDKPKFVQPERRSYFVAGNTNNNEINTTAQRPNEIEYEADTVDDEKKKDNYFGLSKLKTNKRDIVKNALKYVVQAPNLIQNAANTIGKFTGKSGEDVALEGVRGFTGSTVDFASSMARFFGQNYMYFKAYKDEQLDKITNLGNVVAGGEDFTDDIKQKYTDFYKRIDEQTKEFKDKTEKFLQYTGIAKTDKDGFIYDLVGGASSLMYAIGLSVITKSPVAAAEAFGAYQYQSLYEEGIEKGFSPIKARSIGVAGGTFEGLLEGVGLHVFIEGLAARRSFTKILRSAATELVQEASQQGAEEILTTATGMREESLKDALFNVGYAGLIGALIGGGTAGISNTRFVQKMISDSATKELISKGVNSEYAKQMVDKMLEFSVSPQMTDEVVGMIKDEESPVTYKNADPRETYKETGEAIKKALDPQQKRGVELEFIDEKKKFVDSVANALINSGRFTQEEAYKQAEAQANLADGLARIGFEQDNIRPSEYYKRFKVDVTSGNIETDERNIDEDNPLVDVSFDPVDFDPQARAEYEAAMDAQQEEIDKLQKEFTMSLKDHAKFFSELGIEAIRRPTPDGVGKDRWGEYKDLSPRIKNYFFSDDATMSWDDAEKLLAESSSNIKDLFEYLTKADETAKTYNQKEIFNKVLTKEKEDIKQKAIADGTFMKAPNGKNSKLPEQLWLTVRTKVFKNWFGDWLNDPQNASKVVDENGEPLVVYHGTNAKFSKFRESIDGGLGRGIYFTEDELFAKSVIINAQVMPVFLNIRNPYITTYPLNNKENEQLRQEGYDGIYHKGNRFWVTFDSKQVKSINNRGRFDPRNPNIYLQAAYHGTPHRFDTFSTDKIGTGEGAQAHGWGLYFAANKGVSEGYRQRLVNYNIVATDKNGPIDEQIADSIVAGFSYRDREKLTDQEIQKKIKDKFDNVVKEQNEVVEKYENRLETINQVIKYLKNNQTFNEFYESIPQDILKENMTENRSGYITVKDYMLDYVHRDIASMKNIDKIFKDEVKADSAYIEQMLNVLKHETERSVKYTKERLDKIKQIDKQSLKITINKGQLFKVDIPEDDVLLDEDTTFIHQPKKVQEAIRKMDKAEGLNMFSDTSEEGLIAEIEKFSNKKINKEKVKKLMKDFREIGSDRTFNEYWKFLSDNLDWQQARRILSKTTELDANNDLTGKEIYKYIWDQKKRDGSIYGPKGASLLLNKYGIKGITYVGYNDGRAYVIFDDKAVKVLEKFYQQQQEQPRGATTVFDRQYFINLFANADKSTLMHEMAHAWLSEINYFAKAKNATQKVLDLKKQLDNWLGVPDNNGRYSTEQQEQFAQNFEVYLKEGKAPTAKLKTVFARFKTWLSEIYDRIKDDLPKLSDDVRELFDSILSRSYDVPDSNTYAGKEKAIKEVIKNIQEGRASEVDGITIDDVYNLLNMAYTRKPRRPNKNLKQLLNDKNIYDFNELNKAGADTVLQILKDGGYVKADATAEQAIELAKTALDGNPVYRLSDQWRVAGDIDFARNLRVLEKVIEFSQIDSTLEKILSLQQEGYRNVEQSDVDKVQDEYKRLMSADVKEAKKIVEDIINRLHKKRFIDRAAQKQMIVDLNFSSTVEEIRESVLNVIEDLQDEIKLVKEQLRNPRKPVVRKDKTIPPGKNATEEEKNTYKKYMRKQINRLLKQVLPSKQNNNKVSKFGNIEIQRFFEELIRINKMSREEAERFAMDRIAKDNEWILKDEKGEGFENKQKIINMFVSYKSKIITQNSPELLKELYDNLQKINIAGRNEKQINDYLTKAKQNKDMDELLDNIEKNGSKNKVSNWIKTFYNYAVANWYSCINSIAGEKQAEKDALELYEKNASVKAKTIQDRIVKRTCDVLGLKTRSQFDKKIHDYLKEKYEFVQNKIDHNGNEVQRKQTLNKMELICCYIWAKNKQLKERIIRAYGNEQFNEMMAKLDKYDMSWGDIIQEETASLYDDVNKVYVKMYGLDMPQSESYFPSSTERIQGNMDLLKDVIIQTSSPSFIKGRIDSNLIIMKFGNPINIAFNHIFKASRFAVMQEKLAEIYKTYLHPDVSDKLKDMYGSDKIFNYIKKMLDNIKFENFAAQVDIVNSIFDHLANTYVITRIAGKPSIMIKQLLSFTNYMEDVDSTLWLKYFGKMVANPSKFKQIKEFMYKHSPYLKQRYESGSQNEALEKAMEGQANALLRIKSFKGFLSIMTRVGDIGAIIFGGYPMIQAQLEKGVPIEKAFENFEKATLRSQQANFASTLSNWQNYVKQNPLLRAIFAFANTPTQYTRKLVDVCYKMAHGDEKFIKGKGFKTLALYGIEQSFVYTAFTSLALLNGLVNGDWDDLKDDVWLSLFQVSNFLGIPILGQVYNQAVSMYVTGNFVQDKRVPIIDDMTDFFKAIKKAYDNGLGDMDVKDWIDTTDKLASITTGVPIKTLYNTWISSWADIINGDYGKGFVKLYGATESRANKIFD